MSDTNDEPGDPSAFEEASPNYEDFAKEDGELAEAYMLGVRDALMWASGSFGESITPHITDVEAAATACFEYCEASGYQTIEEAGDASEPETIDTTAEVTEDDNATDDPPDA